MRCGRNYVAPKKYLGRSLSKSISDDERTLSGIRLVSSYRPSENLGENESEDDVTAFVKILEELVDVEFGENRSWWSIFRSNQSTKKGRSDEDQNSNGHENEYMNGLASVGMTSRNNRSNGIEDKSEGIGYAILQRVQRVGERVSQQDLVTKAANRVRFLTHTPRKLFRPKEKNGLE